MSRPVVTVGAVHQPLVSFGDLILGERVFNVRILGNFTVLVLDSDIGDIKPFLVTGNKGNFLAYVPVDTTGVWRLGVAADMNQHVNAARRLFLVRGVMVEDCLAAHVKLFRLMT